MQMPTHDFDHVVEEGFVGIGGVDGKEFQQGQELCFSINGYLLDYSIIISVVIEV